MSERCTDEEVTVGVSKVISSGSGAAVRAAGSGAVDGLEDERRPVTAAGVQVLGGHVGHSAVALGLRVEPADAFEIAADQTLQWIAGSEANPDAEASIGARLANQVVSMADVHGAAIITEG
jgi:hypothetical protein